ncbi:MAG: Na/Pi cotransporter family protein [Bacteroidales bacterium]|nr:Na/Pi cotransporter family protein [Bacteroidales bacterium]
MIILKVLSVIGALSLFLFGMKLMSEALQRVAGNRLRNILASVTSSRLKAVATGIMVTGTLQSSSAVTVMVVSIVNAGLLSLTESVGLIMGANIGTTATGWLVAYLGFKFNLSTILLPLLALSLPLIYFSKTRIRSWGEFILGFGILFLGLGFLKESMPSINAESALLKTLGSYSDSGTGSILTFTGLGLALTLLFQSSSAVMALTFVMCSKGWISYEMAAAMVLGENVGTTVTANLAAIVANNSGKRAALIHFLFNFFGVIWAILFFVYLIRMVDAATVFLGSRSPYTDALSIPLSLSIFHTVFNVINTLIFSVFSKQLIRISKMIIPVKKEEEEFRLVHMRSTLLSTSELSLVQARSEIHVFAKRITKMFGMIPELLLEKGPKKYTSLYERILRYENIADNMEVEIADYLTKITESKLSPESTKKLRSMLKIIDDLESIGDICKEMADIIDAKNRQNIWFTQDMRNHLNLIFGKVDETLEATCGRLSREYSGEGQDILIHLVEKVRQLKDKLQDENRESIKKGEYAYQNGVYYSELIKHCDKIGDFVLNVNEAITGTGA